MMGLVETVELELKTIGVVACPNLSSGKSELPPAANDRSHEAVSPPGRGVVHQSGLSHPPPLEGGIPLDTIDTVASTD